MTREAVRQRLGELETEGGRPWHGSYSTVHDPTGRRGDYVRLVIRDAEGKEHLRRELAIKGESCETLAQAIALVIDSFFRELDQTPTHEELEPPQAQHDANNAQARKPSDTVGSAGSKTPGFARQQTTPKANGRQHRVSLVLSGGYESVPSSATLVAGLAIAWPQQWRLQLQASLPFLEERERHDRVVALEYVVPVRLSWSYVFEPTKSLEWSIGPEALFSLERGDATEVSLTHNGWRVSPGIGAQTGLTFWATQAVGIGAHLAADEVLFQSREFELARQPVLQLPRTRLSANFGIAAVFWP